MIRHTVVFSLVHASGSDEETRFLEEARVLAGLPMVRNFEQLRQVSPKNDFRFGFSMEFDDQAAYDSYHHHPVHEAFVKDHWVAEVSNFLEIDYVPLS